MIMYSGCWLGNSIGVQAVEGGERGYATSNGASNLFQTSFQCHAAFDLNDSSTSIIL